MKSNKIFIPVAFLVVAVLGLTAFINTGLLKNKTNGGKGFAVVELYTSEGCSSCPPADELVARVQKESKDKPVYILAYHVDYWDRLGWKDVFSSADYSKRQTDYARYLHLQSVYTPQIIVNGQTEFVGSQESTLRNAIRASLQKTPAAKLVLTVLSTGQNQASLKYSTEGTDKNTVLLLALVQKSAQTKVERGENSGHTLSHVQIVRKLQKAALNGVDGQANVALPHGFEPQNWEIIGFLQNTATGVVTGAARAEFMVSANVVSATGSKNSK